MEFSRDRRLLRASHDEREQTVEVLRREAGLGRLDVEELTDRVGKALSAKTVGELQELVWDLPADAQLEPVVTQPPIPPPWRAPGFATALMRLVLLNVLVLGFWIHAVLADGGRPPVLLPLLFVVMTVLRFGRRVERYYEREARSRRRAERSGPPTPPGVSGWSGTL